MRTLNAVFKLADHHMLPELGSLFKHIVGHHFSSKVLKFISHWGMRMYFVLCPVLQIWAKQYPKPPGTHLEKERDVRQVHEIEAASAL